jgi:hypothetical protein
MEARGLGCDKEDSVPVMMVMEWDGVTLEQYERSREVVNFEGDPPRGGLFHVAAHDGQKLRITDVWESAEDFNRFVQDRLMPGVQQLGIQGQPNVEIYPAYNVFTPGYTPK